MAVTIEEGEDVTTYTLDHQEAFRLIERALAERFHPKTRRVGVQTTVSILGDELEFKVKIWPGGKT